MELTGTRTIQADRETVWRALLDPDVLKACIPGCSSLTGSAEEGFEATVTQKVGPVKATFKGAVTMDDMVRPERLRMSGEGKGGPAGFAKGGADVTLDEASDGTGTELGYAVDARVGGKLAQLGSRVVDAFARKMADQFFERFQEQVEGPGAAVDTKPAEAMSAQKPTGGADPAPAEEPVVQAEGPQDPTPPHAPGEEKKGFFKKLLG